VTLADRHLEGVVPGCFLGLDPGERGGVAVAALGNEKDLNNLKSSLLQPFLQNKWAKDKEQKGQKILNKGVAIIEARDKLHDEILVKERSGADVSKEKIQLETMDKILSEIS